MKLLVLLVSLGVCHNALGAPGGRIIGGDEAEPGQFPYSVSVQYKTLNGDFVHHCGGSIIGNRTILTAAHCIASFRVYRVYIGSNKLDGDGDAYEVIDYMRDIYFDPPTAAYDVGVIHLKENIVFSPLVQPIELDAEIVSAEDIVTVSGWGLIGVGPSVYTNEMHFIDLRTIDQRDCRDRLPQFPFLPQRSHICVLNKSGEGLCLGDSGSPAVRNGKQVGLVSWSGSLCANRYPDGLARITSSLSWIKENTI